MNYLHKSVPSKAPLPPAGLVQAPVQFAAIDSQGRGSTPVEAARKEWFLQGTQQAAFAMKSGAAGGAPTASAGASRLRQQPARITSPTNGSIIALDPDIPPSHQRVTFTAEGQVRRWQMDGKTFAKGASAQWLPWPGRHVVQVIDARGEVLDEVRLEVRGAGVKLAQASH
jgi:penicillin-binding protein 1C